LTELGGSEASDSRRGDARGARVLTWMGLVGGVVLGGLMALTGNVGAAVGAGLGFAMFGVVSGQLAGRGRERLGLAWLALSMGTAAGFSGGLDGLSTPLAAGYGLAIAVALWFAIRSDIRLGLPIDRTRLASVSGGERRRLVRLRRLARINLLLTAAILYAVVAVWRQSKHVLEWAFLAAVVVWSSGMVLGTRILGPRARGSH
jgi:hypothetical protein